MPLLPTTLSSGEVIQTDVLGRVRVSRARREALLDEFERGGASGQAFAALAGIKYPTFATWVQARRRARGECPPALPTRPKAALPMPSPEFSSLAALRLVEAVVETGAPPTAVDGDGAARLRIHLPGGAHAEVATPARPDWRPNCYGRWRLSPAPRLRHAEFHRRVEGLCRPGALRPAQEL